MTGVQTCALPIFLRFPKNRFIHVELNPAWNGFFPFNLDLGSIWFVGVIRNNSKEFGSFLDTMRVCVWVNFSRLENKLISLEPDQSDSFGGTQSSNAYKAAREMTLGSYFLNNPTAGSQKNPALHH